MVPRLPTGNKEASYIFFENQYQKFWTKIPALRYWYWRDTMYKCHCGEVFFEDIVRRSLESGQDYRQVMVEMGAGQICRACTTYLHSYCQSRLESSDSVSVWEHV